MYTWNNSDSAEPKLLKFSTFIIFGSAAASALIMAVLLHTYFNDFMTENPVINYILFGPAFGTGSGISLMFKIDSKSSSFAYCS